MRILALEEHVVLPAMLDRLSRQRGGVPGYGTAAGPSAIDRALGDFGAERLRDMDEAGISLQVLSVVGAGAETLAGDAARQFARDYNDSIAGVVGAHPARYAAFAHLPLSVPDAAADELERCVREHRFCGALVNGTVGGVFLDDPGFDVVLERAARLGCPIYLHPAPPPASVRAAYYAGLPGDSGGLLATAGFGWHAETAIHVLRLILSGTLDRHPTLKLIVGHMGEFLPMLFGRLDQIFGRFAETERDRAVSATLLDQVWITTSGFFDHAAFLAALTAFGPERILFSVDYPYSANRTAVNFLHRLPASKPDIMRIASGNADALLGLSGDDGAPRRFSNGSGSAADS